MMSLLTLTFIVDIGEGLSIIILVIILPNRHLKYHRAKIFGFVQLNVQPLSFSGTQTNFVQIQSFSGEWRDELLQQFCVPVVKYQVFIATPRAGTSSRNATASLKKIKISRQWNEKPFPIDSGRPKFPEI
jgi:hypothetical protein